MSALKIVPLRPDSAWTPRIVERQSNLFGELHETGRYYSLIHINDVDQDTLLSTIAKNHVKTIVDLRKLPLFDRPKFQHRQVVNYFKENQVLYLEYALAVKNPKDFHPLGREGDEPLGLSIWLYDDSTVSTGWYEHVRKALKSTPLFQAEVSPRALIRS